MLAFIQENPEESAARFNLALVYDRMQEWEKAIAAYEKALELDPESVDAAVGGGAALINAKQLPRAVESLRSALANHPDHLRLQELLALALYNQGQPEEASALYEKVREAEPENPTPYYYLGMIAVQETRAADAIELLERFVAMNPPNPADVEAAKGLIEALKKQVE
jgi:superkiller protein 3